LKDSILKCFDSLILNKPQSKAIKYNDTILTYSQLDILVNKIANLIKVKLEKIKSLDSNSGSNLNEPDLNKELIIPIFIYKSHFTVASILAIWKLGYSFTVIDKRTPKARFEEMIKQLNTELIINESFISELNSLGEDFENPVDSDNYISVDDLALVCFTSGTTGTPKGVMINYKQISLASRNISMELLEKYLTSKCVITLIPSFSMIAAHLITFGVMFSKGYLHIIPDEKILDLHYLIKYMKMNKINGSMFPPQLAEKFLRYADGLLEAFIVSTDKVSNIYSSKTTIINLYGQTETLGFNTHFKIDKPYKDTPIGKPANNNKIYLLDENLEEVNDGVMGEIYVAGQLALGYLNDKKLTDEKFIPNPYSSSSDDKVLYKTGDLAYYNTDGNLVFLQRKDFMLNIHGYRVEPTEIEQNTLKIDESITQAICASFDCSNITKIANDTRLYLGYVSHKLFYEDFIKIKLQEVLPAFMIPSVIQAIDSVPLNNNGKIDRQNIVPENILELFQKKNQERTYVAPRDDTERLLVKAYSETLNLDEDLISITDDFFYLGGDSIQASELLIKINEMIDKQIVYFGVFRTHRTVSSLSKFIKEHDQIHIFTFNSNNIKPPLFFVHSCAGGSILYTELAKHISKDQGFYVLEFPYYEEDENLVSINSVAKTYIKHIKTVVPEGPYYIGGWSLGGIIAYEIAKILDESGDKVIKLFLLDPTFYTNIKMTVINDPIHNAMEKTNKEIKTLLENGEVLRAEDLKIFAHKNDLLGKAAFRYRPKFYGGDVILFRAKDSKVGWSKYNGLEDNAKNIEVVDINAVHLEMNKGKAVEEIANIINSY